MTASFEGEDILDGDVLAEIELLTDVMVEVCEESQPLTGQQIDAVLKVSHREET